MVRQHCLKGSNKEERFDTELVCEKWIGTNTESRFRFPQWYRNTDNERCIINSSWQLATSIGSLKRSIESCKPVLLCQSQPIVSSNSLVAVLVASCGSRSGGGSWCRVSTSRLSLVSNLRYSLCGICCWSTNCPGWAAS